MLSGRTPDRAFLSGTLSLLSQRANEGYLSRSRSTRASRDVLEPSHEIRSGGDGQSAARHHTPISKPVSRLENGWGISDQIRHGCSRLKWSMPTGLTGITCVLRTKNTWKRGAEFMKIVGRTRAIRQIGDAEIRRRVDRASTRAYRRRSVSLPFPIGLRQQKSSTVTTAAVVSS